MMRKRNLRSIAILASITMLATLPLSAEAAHSWSNYHWGHTTTPFTIKLVDSMSDSWDGKLDLAIADWHSSSVLDVVEEAGDSSSKARKRCAAVSGKVRACNAAYGNNGWLGLAQVWVSGSHIVQAIAKMNDTYLASSSYSETNRRHVICQEIGHDWGLGHQDESGADLNTCMDYDKDLTNPSPNPHDFAQLETIYLLAKGGHLDSGTTAKAMPPGFANANARALDEWGKKVHESANGRTAVFVREFGAGLKIITHVTWAR